MPKQKKGSPGAGKSEEVQEKDTDIVEDADLQEELVGREWDTEIDEEEEELTEVEIEIDEDLIEDIERGS